MCTYTAAINERNKKMRHGGAWGLEDLRSLPTTATPVRKSTNCKVFLPDI